MQVHCNSRYIPAGKRSNNQFTRPFPPCRSGLASETTIRIPRRWSLISHVNDLTNNSQEASQPYVCFSTLLRSDSSWASSNCRSSSWITLVCIIHYLATANDGRSGASTTIKSAYRRGRGQTPPPAMGSLIALITQQSRYVSVHEPYIWVIVPRQPLLL